MVNGTGNFEKKNKTKLYFKYNHLANISKVISIAKCLSGNLNMCVRYMNTKMNGLYFLSITGNVHEVFFSLLHKLIFLGLICVKEYSTINFP